MVGAVIIGIALGVVSFLPLILGMRLARNASPTSNFGHAGSLLLGVLLSVVILGVGVIACIALFRAVAVPFTVGVAAGLIVSAAAFAISKNARK